MPDIPAGKTAVAESGISDAGQLSELERVGVDAVLIGEALMRASDREAQTREFASDHDSTREQPLP
jgi:indole-3-glycerol phosphate synthase